MTMVLNMAFTGFTGVRWNLWSCGPCAACFTVAWFGHLHTSNSPDSQCHGINWIKLNQLVAFLSESMNQWHQVHRKPAPPKADVWFRRRLNMLMTWLIWHLWHLWHLWKVLKHSLEKFSRTMFEDCQHVCYFFQPQVWLLLGWMPVCPSTFTAICCASVWATQSRSEVALSEWILQRSAMGIKLHGISGVLISTALFIWGKSVCWMNTWCCRSSTGANPSPRMVPWNFVAKLRSLP